MTHHRQRGRTPKADKQHVIDLLNKGLSPEAVGKTVGLSTSRVRAVRVEAGISPGNHRRTYCDNDVLFGRYVPPPVQRPGFLEPQPGFCTECVVRPATEDEVAEFGIKGER